MVQYYTTTMPRSIDSALDFSRIEVIGGREKGLALGLFLAVCATAIVSAVAPARTAIAVLALATAFVLTVRYATAGLYILIALAPFTGLVLDFSQYAWSQDIPYLRSIDAPWVDAWAVFLLGAVIVRWVVANTNPHPNPLPASRTRQGEGVKKSSLSLVGEGQGEGTLLRQSLFFFLPFLLVSFLSTFNADPDLFLRSVKYAARPILFFFVAFVALPVHLIATKEILRKCLLILYGAGLAGALMGVISLFTVEPFFGVWRRATTLTFGGFAPFAYNHNLLAEWLVVVAPIAVYMIKRERNERRARIFFMLAVFLIAVALATLARTAWIALAVEGLLYGALLKKGKLTAVLRRAALPALVILLPLVVYMMLFSASPLVRSSTATRLDLTRIALTHFARNPVLGSGAGAFIPLVEETKVFRLEYGDPLDAHGVIQKLMAEEGILGLAAFFLFVAWALFAIYRAYALRPSGSASRMLMLLLFVSAVGGFTYQLFNTSYYNSKLWIPIGVALAAAGLFGTRKTEA